MARFYSLSLSRDLFGTWCLIRRYGRIGARRGQMRLEAFEKDMKKRKDFSGVKEKSQL